MGRATAILLFGAMLALLGCGSATGEGPSSLVYEVREQPGVDQAASRGRTLSVLRRRLRAAGLEGVTVAAAGQGQIRIAGVGDVDVRRRARSLIEVQGALAFYDWEPSLVGRELAIGGHPGRRPPADALAEATAEWRAAGRNPTRPPSRRLILAGAYPTSSAAAAAAPEGAALVSEAPVDNLGEPLTGADPGWFALVGEPALRNGDVVRPAAALDESGVPTVTFSFTGAGRRAFEGVTREIARRGRSQAPRNLGSEGVERFSNHFAIVLDDEVRTRPIINFKENPDGIDGRTGAQVSGGFTGPREAEELAAILRAGELPATLVPVPRAAKR